MNVEGKTDPSLLLNLHNNEHKDENQIIRCLHNNLL